MREIETDDLFEMTEIMPCTPHDIRVGCYNMPGSPLNRFEREEAAARVLFFSQIRDQWVGVSWKKMSTVMLDEYETYNRIQEIRDANTEEKRRYKTAMLRYARLGRRTLGLYTWFVSVPKLNLREIPENVKLLSGIFLYGPNHVITGIRELVENGMLRQEKMEDGSERDVFFPTVALLQRIMEAQGVQPHTA